LTREPSPDTLATLQKGVRVARKRSPLILYSANSLLSYQIAQQFYHEVHYVWCAPYFDADAAMRAGFTAPPSSTPCDIYQNFAKDIARGDLHSAKIAENRAGLLRGAQAKLTSGIITQQDFDNIGYIIRSAQLTEFQPRIYVVPFASVKSQAVLVPPARAASLMFPEFLIDSLSRDSFDIIAP
jgi:hypothetical protein